MNDNLIKPKHVLNLLEHLVNLKLINDIDPENAALSWYNELLDQTGHSGHPGRITTADFAEARRELVRTWDRHAEFHVNYTHFAARLRELRSDRHKRESLPRPPSELAHQPQLERAWLQIAAQAIGDGYSTDQAALIAQDRTGHASPAIAPLAADAIQERRKAIKRFRDTAVKPPSQPKPRAGNLDPETMDRIAALIGLTKTGNTETAPNHTPNPEQDAA